MKKLFIICVILGFSFVYAAWDNDLPADNQVWNTAAEVIRDNWDALEVELGVDLAGAHPYYQATTPTTKPDGSTALDSTDLGRIWIDSDDNKMYVFTAVTPTWTPYPSLVATGTWTAQQTFSVAPIWTLGVVPNNVYLTATDQAGTGTVELIKANTSDVAVIPDGSQLATSGAPVADADIANKKYVDDTAGSVQVVNTQTGTVNTGATGIPFDDTIPTKTEGDQYMTLAITPTSASNILVIEVVVNCSATIGGELMIALFQDATSAALAVCWGDIFANAQTEQIVLRYRMLAGTTSETTFKVRGGPSVATGGTFTFNGVTGSRRFGGVLMSSITITETSP